MHSESIWEFAFKRYVGFHFVCDRHVPQTQQSLSSAHIWTLSTLSFAQSELPRWGPTSWRCAGHRQVPGPADTPTSPGSTCSQCRHLTSVTQHRNIISNELSSHTVCLCSSDSEVSCKNLEGMDGLKRLLYQVACSMKDISNPASCHKLVGRLVRFTLFYILEIGTDLTIQIKSLLKWFLFVTYCCWIRNSNWLEVVYILITASLTVVPAALHYCFYSNNLHKGVRVTETSYVFD